MTPPFDYSRRRFVRSFAVFTASAIWPVKNWEARILAQVQPSALADQGLLRIKLSDFPVLQEEFGSVRIGTSALGPDHRPVGLFYPVIINRGSNNRFFALDAACTHEGCTVPTFDRTAGYMECPCHGSRYLIDGQVVQGPANFPLRQFTIHSGGADELGIELPDLSFALEAIQVKTGPQRLQLTFIAFDQLEYEVHFRPDANSAWSGPVGFSLSPNGPLNQSVVIGQANYETIFLDEHTPNGFYAVALRIRQV